MGRVLMMLVRSALLLLPMAGAATAENLTARAALGTNSAFVGEPLRFQIQVSGSESPEQPKLPTVNGLSFNYIGGGANSRRSVQFVNGRRSENVQLGYIFNYEIRAMRDGVLSIPAIEVKADGETALTQPLTLMAQKPSETEDFKLRLTLSKSRAYVGEQLVLEGIFYFRANVSEANMTLPLVENQDFEVYDLATDARKKLEVLDGKQFNTLRIRKVVVPRRAGAFKLEPATLTFQGQDGTEMVRDPFRGTVRRAKYRNFVIPSNQLELTVMPLPTEGQPPNFGGHVGEFTLSVQAAPTEMNVGDPITLNLAVAGPAFLEPVKLPPLNKQETLTSAFKVPNEIEDGTVNGTFKMFTQTIRALRDDVKMIPAIELPYFDTASGTYQVARSRPIPIVVNATRVLTAGDAEGLTPVMGAKQEIQSWMQGIAYNYSGPEVLATQVLGFSGLFSPGRLALVAGPPVAYGILLALVAAQRKRAANPEIVRSRRALGEFNREVGSAGDAEAVLSVFRAFLGDKLALASEAITYRDVEVRLREQGVPEEHLVVVKDLFTAGEASRFAGGGGSDDVGELRDKAANLAKELDKTLR